MQTFLPYPDFAESMRVLDPSRLGNQVYREGYTLIKGGWPNHPASRMWQGYESALALYCLAGVAELESRTGESYWLWQARFEQYLPENPSETIPLPKWVGSNEFHASHRSNLLRKDPQWYGRFGWTESPDLPYVWPSEVKPIQSIQRPLFVGKPLKLNRN